MNKSMPYTKPGKRRAPGIASPKGNHEIYLSGLRGRTHSERSVEERVELSPGGDAVICGKTPTRRHPDHRRTAQEYSHRVNRAGPGRQSLDHRWPFRRNEGIVGRILSGQCERSQRGDSHCIKMAFGAAWKHRGKAPR